MTTNRVYRIAVIPGDGIGKEVVPEGLRVLEAASKKFGFELRNDHFDFASYDYYARHGRMMPGIGRIKSAGMTRSFSARSAGRRKFLITSRCGARLFSSAASSTNM